MSKSASIHVRVEPSLKESAEKILGKLGLSASEALTLFYRQIMLHKGLPFDVKIPNATTRKAIRDMQKGRAAKEYGSLEEMWRELKKC